MFALSGKGKNLRLRFDSSASERTLPQATARRARSDSDEVILHPAPFILLNSLQCDFTPGGVPERPKGADCKSAVIDFEGSNPSPTTILLKNTAIQLLYDILDSALRGRDEKLRLRFDSSASERTLPRATARRARSDSDELSFPHHHPLKNTAIQLLYDILDSALRGRDEKLRLRFDSSASERTLPQAMARRARSDSDELSFPLYSRALCNHLYCYLLARASLSEATSTVLLPPRSRFA